MSNAADLAAVADKYANENVKLRGIVGQLLKERDEGCDDGDEMGVAGAVFAFLLGCIASFVVLRMQGKKG